MASDSFTGVDDTALATHDANWGDVTATYVVANMKINSGLAKVASTSASGGGRYTTSTRDESQIVFKGLDAYYNGRYVTIRSDGTNMGYAAYLGTQNALNFGRAGLNKNGVFVDYFTTTLNVPWGSDHTVRLWVSGSGASTVIHLDVDGTERGSGIADASPLSAGNPGFASFDNGTNLTRCIFDDWTDNAPVVTSNPQVRRFWAVPNNIRSLLLPPCVRMT